MRVDSRGVISLIVLGLVLIGIGAGIYLIRRPAIFGSKASSFPYAQVVLSPVCEGTTPKVKLTVKYTANSFSTPYIISKQNGYSGSYQVFGNVTENAGSEQMSLEQGEPLNLSVYETMDGQIEIGTWYFYKVTNSDQSTNYESIPVMIIGPDCVRGGPQSPAMQMPNLPQLPQVSPIIPIPSEMPIPVPSGMPIIPAVPSITPIFSIPPEPSVQVPNPSSFVMPSLPPTPSILPVSQTAFSLPTLDQVRCLVGQIVRVVDQRLVCTSSR